MDIHLRCAGRLHGIVTDATGIIEVKCSHIACIEERGAVALHYFDLATGLLKDTKQYSQDFWKRNNRKAN